MACNFMILTKWADTDQGKTAATAVEFEHVWGPGKATGDTIHISKPMRDGMWKEGDLAIHQKVVVTEGLRGHGVWAEAPSDKALTAIIIGTRAVKTLKTPIHSSKNSEVLAMWGNDGVTDPVKGYPSWLPKLPFSATRWNRVYNFLLDNGATASRLDKWRNNHKDATPHDLLRAMRHGHIW